jgi:filamentous hemagglutinin family protein
MNKSYKLVWSSKASAWVVVSEITRGRGKASRPAVLVSALALAMPQLAHAQVAAPATITPANASTKAYVSPNGVPVVNIANPNAAGLSHNKYNQFNVQSNGAVLNNAVGNQQTVNTKLAGQILTNENLTKSASVILNEVTSNNRSTLAGFTEVAGQKADVVVANPYGITCQGCGFINTDRATITTGTPNLSGGALTGFTVSGGDVAIGTGGANLTDQQKFDIVTRSVTVAGQVNAQDLQITTGANEWSYATRSVTGPAASSGTAPTYAIDSSALGGMYADRITIVSTETGVGARLLGNAASGNGDFTITTDGKLEVQSALSATGGNLTVTNTSNQGSKDLYLNGAGARLASDGTVTLTLTSGNVYASGGEVYAKDVSVSAASIETKSGAQWTSSESTTIVASGALVNAGNIVSDQALTFTAASLNNSGVLQSKQTGSATVTGALVNSGTLTLSDRAIYDGALAAGTLNNTGTIQSSGDLGVTVTGSTFANAGTVLSSGNLTVTSTGASLDLLNESGGQIQAGGNPGNALTVTGTAVSFTNESGAKVLADTLSITASALTNSGVLKSDGTGTLAVTASGAVVNSGAIHSANDLTISATAITNAGALYAANNLTAAASAGTIKNAANGTSDYSGTIDGGNVTLTAATLVNNSKVNSTGNITISAATIQNEVPGGDTRVYLSTPTVDGSPYEYKAHDVNLSGYNYETEYWKQVDSYQQRYDASGSTTRPSVRPSIISGGTTTLQNFTSAKNIGGVISGKTVNVTGQSGATFTNDDLALQEKTVTETWTVSKVWAGVVDAAIQPDSQVTNASTTALTYATIPGSSTGAGVFANTLSVTNVALTNAGSPYSDSTTIPSVGGTAARVSKVLATTPTNPNGYFVTSQNPSSRYLVETNPSFAVVPNAFGSDYFYALYGYRPENIARRLGDSNYEAALVRQQLIEQVGRATLLSNRSEAQQLQTFWNNAYAQGNRLGLTPGVALTASQQAALTQDMIWMVETEVNGQRVLAPVVYLAATTKLALASGAVIEASDATFALDSLTNTGGVIAGTKTLSITAKNDITNTSGTISGGDVSLKSTAGSIKNETLATTTGSDDNIQTTVGKTGTISSTGSLALDAAKDITVLGATVSATGSASLTAGGEVKFDTVENKYATSSGIEIDNGRQDTTLKSTTQVKSGLTVGGDLAVKSGKDVTFAGTDASIGGNAKIDAAGDINIIARDNKVETTIVASTEGFGVGGGYYGEQTTTTEKVSSRNVGSTFKVGGNADLTASGDLLVQGSTLTVGGDTSITANDVKVVQGNDYDSSTTTTKTTTYLQIEGDLRNGEEKLAYATADGGATLDSTAKASTSSADGQYLAEASAGFSAEASGKAAAGASYANDTALTLSKSTTQVDKTTSSRAVGSALKLGGNVKITAKNDVTLQGSDLDVGGNLDLSAKNVNLLAAENTETSSSSTEVVRTGIYAETRNEASAEASASAGAQGLAGASASANTNNYSNQAKTGVSGSVNAEVGVSADAKTTNNVDFLRVDLNSTESKTVTNTGSTIRTGGNTKIAVANTLKAVGSTIDSAGNVDLSAKDITFEEAKDTTYTKTSKSTTRAGIYVDAGTDAAASAEASAGLKTGTGAETNGVAGGAKVSGSASASAQAEAEANAKASSGVQVRDTRDTLETGSTTARVSGIKAGGNLTRTATGTIKDVGTSIEAGGDFTQSAKTVVSLAAENSQYSKSSSDVTTARLGTYAEADAGAEAGASAKAQGGASAGTGITDADGSASAKAKAKAEAGARVGIEVSLDQEHASESTKRTQAVVSNIKVGGKLKSTSSDSTTLQGTSIQAGGDVELNAAKLDILAAKDTETTSKDSEKTNFSLGVSLGVGAKAEAQASASSEGGGSGSGEGAAGVQVGVSGGLKFEGKQSTEDATTAVASTIGGRSIKINTSGATTLEGTKLDAGTGGVAIAADSLDFKAAQNTKSSTKSTQEVDATVEFKATVLFGSNIDAKADVGVGVGVATASESQASVGGIKSAGGLTVITKNDTRLEGTQVAVAGDTNIIAGGDVKIDAAKNTKSSTDVNVDINAGFDKDAGKFDAGVNVGVGVSKSSEAVVSNLGTKGSLNISAGKNVSIEGANLEAGGDAQLAAGGSVQFKEARNTSSEVNVDVGVQVGGTNKNDKNQLKGNQTQTTGGSFGVDVGVEVQQTSTAVTGSLKAGKNLTVAAGKDVTFVGTELAAGESAQIAAVGNVNFKAAESTSVGVDASVSGGGSVTNKSTRSLADKDQTGAATTSKTNKGSGSFGVDVDVASEQKGASLTVGKGGVAISSGANVNLEGTQIQSTGTTEIAAAGDVNQTSIKNVTVGVGVGAEFKASSTTKGKVDAQESAGPFGGKTSKGEIASNDDGGVVLKSVKPLDPDRPAEPTAASSSSGSAATTDQNASGNVGKSSGGLNKLTANATVESTDTTITGSSVALRSGTSPVAPIQGASMTLRATAQTDGSVRASVPVPAGIPSGSTVRATQPDGTALPAWVRFDPATGTISGTPPANFQGGLNVVVEVPQADGSTRRIGVQF